MTLAAPQDADPDTTVGMNVKWLLWRKRAGQKALAREIGVTPSVLSKKLRGESGWSATQIAITAQFLDVDPGRLFQATVPKILLKVAASNDQPDISLQQPSLLGVVRSD
jgi:transcriptional regulator with XRE-family HTH domain